jgi:ATP-dependent Lon protease
VGGIKIKVLAAHRAGLRTVILPRRNDRDLDELPQEVRQEMTIRLADRVEEAFALALQPDESGTAGDREKMPALG